jgi:Tfp pilus assembly protein PilO
MDTPFLNHDDQQPHRIIIMDIRDWSEFGTNLESLRRTAELQDRRIKELHADIAARDRHAADLLSRLETYRAKDRDEKRTALEAELGVAELPAQIFPTQGP